LIHELTLFARRGLAQQRDASVAMMIVGVVREDLLPDLEREVLDTSALGHCFWQFLAQGNQSLAPAGYVW
jgi:hypothetical protein